MAGILAMTFLFSTVAPGATLEVGSGKTYATIQAAVNAASGGTLVYSNHSQNTAGDTIKVYAGTYAGFTVTGNDMDVLTIQAYQDPENCTAAADRVEINSTITFAEWAEANTIQGFYVSTTSGHSVISGSCCRMNTWKNMVLYNNTGNAAFYGINLWGADSLEHCTIYNCSYGGNFGYKSSARIHDSIVTECGNAWTSSDTSNGYYSDFYKNPSASGAPGSVSNCIEVDPNFITTTVANNEFLWIYGRTACANGAEDGENMGALPNPTITAETLEVGSGKDYATIQAAVDASIGGTLVYSNHSQNTAGDTIKVYAGTYDGFTVSGNSMDVITVVANTLPENCTSESDRTTVTGQIKFTQWAEANTIEGFYLYTPGAASCNSTSCARMNTWKNLVIYTNSGVGALSADSTWGTERYEHCTIYNCGSVASSGYQSTIALYDSIVTECRNGFVGAGSATYTNLYHNPDPNDGGPATQTSCTNNDPVFYSTNIANDSFLCLLTGSSPCINAASDSTNMGALGSANTGSGDWAGAQISFTKSGSNPVLGPSASGTDAGYTNHACVRLNTSGTYMMWYTGAPAPVGSYPRAVHLAVSTDGTSWTKKGAVLNKGNSASWEKYQVHMPTVLWDSSASLWKMWYVGHGDGSGSASDGWQEIGYATSPGGTTWTKSGSNPVLAATETEGDFDRNTCRAPAVVYDSADSTYKMWYYGTSESGQHYGPTGYAESADGVAWSRIAQINDNEDQYMCPDVLLIDGTFHMFHDIGGYKGYAISTNGTDWDDYYLNDVLPKGPSVSDWDYMYNQGATVVYDSSSQELDLWYNAIKDYPDNIERIGLATTSFNLGSTTLFEDDLDDLSNWGTTTGWDLSSTEYVSSPTSIRGDSNAAYLISDPIDTTSYSEITVTFKYYITGIDVNDYVYVSYWDGAAYDNI